MYRLEVLFSILGAFGGIEAWRGSGHFDQRLDHFTSQESPTFKQRYWYDDTWYRSNPSVVFLMVDGESNADGAWLYGGMWLEYAKQVGAFCMELEHRYYGESIPNEFHTDTRNKFRYLSSDQALADIASFIPAINKQFRLVNPKWVLFGGSYPGTLAAWARQRYPSLVHAAISSSAPLEAQLVIPGWQQLRDEANRYKNSHAFQRTFFAHRVFNMELSNNNLRSAKDNPWTYQICNEFGWFQPVPESQLQRQINFYCRHNNLTAIQTRLNRVNSMNRGKNFARDRVMFIHGSIDFWSLAGVTSTRHPDIPAYVIQGAIHCWDMNTPEELRRMFPKLENALAARVQAAQSQVMAYLRRWLA